MKEFFKKTWVKVLLIASIFFGGLLLLGNCQKVDAANFTLADGTVSNITYSEFQNLHNKHNMYGESYMNISKDMWNSIYLINIRNAYGTHLYSSCTLENDIFTCTNYNSIFSSGMTNNITNGLYKFTITIENVIFDDRTYSILPTYSYTEEDVENAIQDYINQYNMKTEEEYLNYGNEKYLQGLEEGENTVDVTKIIDDYCNENICYTYEEYQEIIKEAKADGYSYGANGMHSAIIESITNNDDLSNILIINPFKKDSDENKNVYYNISYVMDDYIVNNNYHDHEEYLEYGEQKYEEGQNSVDIKSDNESAIQSYIAINNMKTEVEYIQYGTTKYNEGKVDGVEEYCTENICLTNEQYQNNLENAKQEGINSVDIKIDNEEYALQYIEDNNYYSLNEVNAVKVKYYDMGQVNILSDIKHYIVLNYDENYNIDYLNITDGNYYDITIKMINDIFDYGKYYIIDNKNYHDHEEYLTYGRTNYTNGKYEGYNFLMDEIIEWFHNKEYEETYIHLFDYHVDMNEINVNEYANGFEGINYTNEIEFYSAVSKIENIGYVQAMEDSDAFLGLIPTVLGSVISNAMPILTYEVYGISLMNLIGLIAIVGVAIIIIKFIVG